MTSIVEGPENSQFYQDCLDQQDIASAALAGAAGYMAGTVALPAGPVVAAGVGGMAAEQTYDSFTQGGWEATCTAIDAGLNAVSDFASGSSGGGSWSE